MGSGCVTSELPGCQNQESEELSQPRGARGDVTLNVVWGPGWDPGTKRGHWGAARNSEQVLGRRRPKTRGPMWAGGFLPPTRATSPAGDACDALLGSEEPCSERPRCRGGRATRGPSGLLPGAVRSAPPGCPRPADPASGRPRARPDADGLGLCGGCCRLRARRPFPEDEESRGPGDLAALAVSGVAWGREPVGHSGSGPGTGIGAQTLSQHPWTWRRGGRAGGGPRGARRASPVLPCLTQSPRRLWKLLASSAGHGRAPRGCRAPAPSG